MPEVKFTSLTQKTAVFEVRDCDLALVNALRRVVIAEVPYVSLPQGEFVCRKNTCVLHNHFLWHRLTQAPMHLSRGEADAYIPGSIAVSLKVDNSEGTKPIDVTTADFKVTLHDQPHPDAARLYPADELTGDHVLLTVLKPGEGVDISGTVVKGIAGDHASFAVASTCAFRPLLDDDLVQAARAGVPADDPQALNRFEHIDRKRAWTPGPDGNPRDFEFTVVSECGLSALDIVQSALDVLERKCTAAVAKLHAGRVPQLEIAGERDTLGNLLQSTAMDELVGEGKPMSYVGYFCPHPLEKRVVFRVASPDPLAAFQAMKDAALARVKDLAHLVSEAAARKGVEETKNAKA
jgi:DNA-directed RNA polymerase subunit L